MHLPFRAGPRRRTRRALLAAALPALLAAVALPVAAQAAVVEEAADGTLRYRAASGESNSLSVSDPDRIGALEIRDLTGLTERTPLCNQVSSIRIRCAIGIRLSEARLGDRNDGFAVSVSTPLVVEGGSGDDAYTAAGTPIGTRVVFRGGDGRDLVHYPGADRGVRITNEGIANDGRPGVDGDNILADVERLHGSPFGDVITALGGISEFCCVQEINGGRGDDVLRDGDGIFESTHFDMGRIADGADRIIGGVGESMVVYEDRTRPVNVTLNFDGADDGEPGEGDEITGSNEWVFGGDGGNVIRAPAGSTAAHNLFGGADVDFLEGADGPDVLVGAADSDTYAANGGDDTIFAADSEFDVVGCGRGFDDFASLDSEDIDGGCENRGVIGTLRLAPKTIKAEAGKPAAVRLSWRHPQSWRRLRQVELRLTHGGVPVGVVTIRPRADRVIADGAVKLVRSRVTRQGKTVAARLALRIDDSLAGQPLTAEVEATDKRGRRQLERDAGTVRVAG